MTENHSSLWSVNEELIKRSQLKKFCESLEEKGVFKNTSRFKDLWEWSVKNPERFWSEVWDFTKIKGIKKGKIIKLLPKLNKAIVSDINKVKKHQKPGNNEPGGIIEKEMPIHLSNLNFFDSKSNKGVRVGFKLNKDGQKLRINKKTGTEI